MAAKWLGGIVSMGVVGLACDANVSVIGSMGDGGSGGPSAGAAGQLGSGGSGGMAGSAMAGAGGFGNAGAGGTGAHDAGVSGGAGGHGGTSGSGGLGGGGLGGASGSGGVTGCGDDSGTSAPGSPLHTLVVGSRHTCAVTPSGQVSCWGQNDLKQLGRGTASPSEATPDLAQVSDVIDLGAALKSTCAVHANGDLTCWGAIFGPSGTAAGIDPTSMSSFAGTAERVALGASHGCVALRCGGLRCFGQDDRGALGNGTLDGTFTNEATDVVGFEGVRVLSLSAGSLNTCAIVDGSPRTLWCWGANDRGQLGGGATGSDSHAPVQVTAVANPTRVSVGTETICALDESGQLLCWGRNEVGQVGDGTTSSEVLSPVPVSLPSGTVDDFSIGGAFGCAAIQPTAGGNDVLCWGVNNTAQLGIGNTMTPVPTPQSNGFSSTVQMLVASEGAHACLLSSGDSVACWGLNADAQTGSAASPRVVSPTGVVGFP